MFGKIKKKELISFGLIWAFLFFIIGLYPLVYSKDLRVWSIIIASIILIILIIKPEILNKFYIIWIKFGEFIGKFMSKIIMFILYFGIFTPTSFVLKILKKDLLRKKINKQENSYWISRDTQPQSMKKQF
ncbi:SxtJ family membrane protein [Malaciobacter mytili]|uniref:SxtJ family membrane protein n=2 Tax=Malaciobacter mytili TaxID=603050 RepID=UPI000E0BA432|nr:SxtJ family membrane protein [Malaciobacter mytili]AXH14189.1 putative membrane protein [Malaciobacter mytili LMG 24559]